MKNKLKEWVAQVPKAELHLHIEGSLEPELMMSLATKHGVKLPYNSIEEVRAAYDFHNLQSFLDLYYLGASVLRDEDDFYQLMLAYLQRCRADNVVHTEIMFDPQTHTERGVGFDIFMPGFLRAIQQAQAQWGQSTLLIMSFLRHMSEASALQTLHDASDYLEHITAVGLDSSELGNPPEKFSRVFAKAKDLGLKRVAHAGEEGPPAYIWGATKTLEVDRIDHGVRSIEDPALVAHLVTNKIPLTVCPLSNTKLKVFKHMSEHNILALLEQGLVVTVNADDPSYFGGYLNDNYHALIDHLDVTQQQLSQILKNGFTASFLSEQEKQHWLAKCN